MPRNLSTGMTEAMSVEDATLLVIDLLTITHADLATPIRVCNNNEDISSRGDVFLGCGFSLKLPDQKESGFPKTRIVVNNVDQIMTDIIRSVSGGVVALIETVSATDLSADPPEFDTVEMEQFPQAVSDVFYDKNQMTFSLTTDAGLNNQYPADRQTPERFPGQF